MKSPLSLERVAKTYRRGSELVRAVADVTFDIEEGEVLGLIGLNGAGKSTTIKIACGLIVPDSGSVLVMGQDPSRQPKILREVGAVLEGSRNLYGRLTALENLEYFGCLKGLSRRSARDRGRFLMSEFELDGRLSSPVQALSRGMQQRISIMVSMINRPKLLFLDEPTLGLDFNASKFVQQRVPELARSDGSAVCVTSHQPEVIRAMADRVAVLRNGSIAISGSLSSVLSCNTELRYEIALDGDLSAKALICLRERFGKVESGHKKVVVPCMAEELYEVFEILNPAIIISVSRQGIGIDNLFGKAA
ncbi:MAG: ABC transporter ATP-binding protein [Steroidobacteraceae bacterium]